MYGRRWARVRATWCSVWLWGVLGFSCGSDDASVEGDAGTSLQDASSAYDCVPSESAYTSAARPLIDTYCASCHGETPKFGAPVSLTSYSATLVPDGASLRPVDHMIHMLQERIMPPANQPQPTDEERAALIRWASCEKASLDGETDAGHGHDDAGAHDGGQHGGALTVSRKPVTSSQTPPADAKSIDLTLDEFTPPTSGDKYQRRSFRDLVSEEVFIRRFEPIVDDERVVHHLTLRFGSGASSYLYIWAPGGSALEFPNGGIRFKPGDSLQLEVHYHNGAGYTDVKDSSGVRLYATAPGGTEYGVANVASWSISVPPMSESEASYSCTAGAKAHVFAALPHMHETGETLTHTVTRSDGRKESIIELSGWDFHQQQGYAVGMDIEAGDVLDLRCGYYNPTSHPVKAGTATTDEMCFDFLYVTPPGALRACNDPVSGI